LAEQGLITSSYHLDNHLSRDDPHSDIKCYDKTEEITDIVYDEKVMIKGILIIL